MLRLRPSELTLTSDDVEETFRRIALRQASRAGNMPHRPLGQPGQPILRRGPQRSTRDALTALGNIPILQPQQAVFTSVDEDDEDEVATSTGRSNIVTRLPSPPRGRQGEPVHLPASLVPRTMQLPFRLGRDRHDPSTHPSPNRPTLGEPRTPPLESSRHVRSGSAGLAIDNISDSATLSPSIASTDSTPGLRGGGGRTSRYRAFSITGDAIHAPSPLHQVQRLSSPPQQEPSGDPTKSPISPGGERPTLYLQGIVQRGSYGTDYTFREIHGPYSEPRQRSGRLGSLMRSLSSRTFSTSRGASQSRASSDPSSDDVFGTLPAVEPPSRPRRGSFSFPGRQQYLTASSNIFHTSAGSAQPDQSSARSRQFSSDASGASAQYSYYGSLDSRTRYPSSENSTQDQFSRLQFDGAAGSHESCGGTQPGSPSLMPSRLDGTVPRPASSGSSMYSSPGMVGSVPHALSPLPSMPYTRTQSDQNTRQLTPGYIEASTAVTQNLQSPLEPYAEHYQRQLQAQHARQLISTQPTPSLHHAFEARRSSHGHGTRPHNIIPGPHGPRAMDSRQLQQVSRSSQRSSEHQTNAGPPISYMYNRSAHSTRAAQRSSENAPVAISSTQGRFAHNNRVQAQRATFEHLQNPSHTMQPGPGRNTDTQPFRHSMPQTATPYDFSNRPREYARNNELLSSPYEVSAPPLLPPQRTQTRTYRPSPANLHLHPALPVLALDHGSGTTSRHPHPAFPSRSPSIRSVSPLIRTAAAAQTGARTRRRIPPMQRDQENDGDRAIMALEAGSVEWRHGIEGEGGGERRREREEMNETPPRVGRVERAMDQI